MEFKFEVNAFAKVILHAAKYPSYPVNGLLIRKIHKLPGSGEKEDSIICDDAIPLTHIPMSKYCTPTMEIALAQIDQHCKHGKCEVVGYYQANQSSEDRNPDFIASRIVEKLHEFNPNLLIFMVENEAVDVNMENVPFNVFKFIDGKFKIQDIPILLLPDDSGCLSTVSSLIQAKAYRFLVDFDDHLEDLRQNYWSNTKVTEVIQQFHQY